MEPDSVSGVKKKIRNRTSTVIGWFCHVSSLHRIADTTELSVNNTGDERLSLSVMTLKMSYFQFCTFYLCAMILSYGEITVYNENVTNWVTYQLKSWEILRDHATLHVQMAATREKGNTQCARARGLRRSLVRPMQAAHKISQSQSMSGFFVF